MKLSFSISSKPSSSRPNSTKPPLTFEQQQQHQQDTNHTGSADEAEAKHHYVTVFDPSKTLTSDTLAKHVIPPIPNAPLRPIKRMKNLLPPPSSDDHSETRFVLDTSHTDTTTTSIPFGLTIRSNGRSDQTLEGEEEEEEDDNRRSEPYFPVEESMLRRYKEDMKNLPEDRGFDEFAEVPVEDFAAALLAGYGWSEGKGIGRNNKGDTKVVQYDRRAGTEGLGYAPLPSDVRPPKRKGRRGVFHEEKKSVPAPVNSEKIVRVIAGRHVGVKGKVLERLESRSDSSSSKLVVLSLVGSGEEVRVGEDMVAELGSVEEEKCLRKLKELEIHGRDERRDKRKEDKRSRDGETKQANSSSHRSSSDRGRVSISWLTSHIRVRIISKDFRGGKLYLKKGEIVDVVGPMTCDISMDGSRELVQGVGQEILETALPKRGGSVLVLNGKHKGVFGSLVERDMEKETGVVRDADSHALVNVRLEHVAEYIGDPSYIGY